MLYRFFNTVTEFIQMNVRVLRTMFRRPYYGWEIVKEMDKMGTYSLPIVFITGFFTGLVMALQTARSLEVFGIKTYIGQVLAISVLREIGPVIGSLMIAGRVASGIAAEIGSMKVGEQVDALRVCGIDVVNKLVTPRIIAGVVILPVLIILVDFFALVGGAVVTVFVLRLPLFFYWSSISNIVTHQDLIMGFTKPIFFGYIISAYSSYTGLIATGGTEGVGRATTNAVVMSSILIILADFILTKIYFLVLW